MDEVVNEIIEETVITLNGFPASIFEYKDERNPDINKVIIIQDIGETVNITKTNTEEIDVDFCVMSQENFLKTIKENEGKFKL